MGHEKKAVRCPVQCGECCGMWRYVARDSPSYFRDCMPSLWTQCPNLNAQGCKLPRKRRPAGCTHYLCEEGVAAVEEAGLLW